jgi:uncharacterized protein YdcH (DUF465 family)
VTRLALFSRTLDKEVDPMENGNSEIAVSNPEFQRLREEHHNHEVRLHELSEKSRLSEDEELEEKRLKKEKLLLKDRMEAIVRHHREEVAS